MEIHIYIYIYIALFLSRFLSLPVWERGRDSEGGCVGCLGV